MLIDEAKIEENLTKVRHLLTKSVVTKPEFNTFEKIRNQRKKFLDECHNSYKEAQSVLISDILVLEKGLFELRKNATGDSDNVKHKIEHYTYLKCILEICFNVFVWFLLRMDKVNVRKIFKGPKYGNLLEQNIDTTLSFVEKENKNINVFVVSLDFCRFASICDLIKVEVNPQDLSLQTGFIELKRGIVNEEIVATIEKGRQDQSVYFEFFEKRGKKGIKQMERYFRQAKTLAEKSELIDAQPGVYKNVIIAAANTNYIYFSDSINKLCNTADSGKMNVIIIDDCLAITVFNNVNEDKNLMTEFLFRHHIQDNFKSSCLICSSGDPYSVACELSNLNICDWREGFSSVILFPPFLRPLENENLFDLLFGRKIIYFYFDIDRFIRLCNERGLETRYTTRKETNRIKSSSNKAGLVEFDGKFIHSKTDIEWNWGEGIFHEIFFNWVKPSSMIETQKNCYINLPTNR
jgi:hypothetical protein